MREGVIRPILTAPNQEWSLDFIHDGLAGGRSLRVLSVVDNFTRECLALEADTSFASQRVTRVLSDGIERRGRPQALRMDNVLNARGKMQACAHVCGRSRSSGAWARKLRNEIHQWLPQEWDPAHHNEHRICAAVRSPDST